MEIFIRKAICIITGRIVQFLGISISKADIFAFIATLLGILGVYKYNSNYLVNTLSVSIIASGLFYFFNLYIPKCISIGRMKRNLKSTLPKIDKLSSFTINQVNKLGTKDTYTFDEFYSLLNKKDEELKLKLDFIAYYNSSKDKSDELIRIMLCQCQILNTFTSRFSNLLHAKLADRIVACCDFTNLAIKSEANNNFIDEGIFGLYKEYLIIINILKALFIIDEKYYTDEYYKQFLKKEKNETLL